MVKLKAIASWVGFHHKKEKKAQECFIEKLPTELLFQIFSYLDPQNLGRAARVCRHWEVIAAGVQKQLKTYQGFPLALVKKLKVKFLSSFPEERIPSFSEQHERLPTYFPCSNSSEMAFERGKSILASQSFKKNELKGLRLVSSDGQQSLLLARRVGKDKNKFDYLFWAPDLQRYATDLGRWQGRIVNDSLYYELLEEKFLPQK